MNFEVYFDGGKIAGDPRVPQRLDFGGASRLARENVPCLARGDREGI